MMNCSPYSAARWPVKHLINVRVSQICTCQPVGLSVTQPASQVNSSWFVINIYKPAQPKLMTKW